MTHAVLNALIRPLVEPSLPRWLEAEWFTTTAELMEMAPRASSRLKVCEHLRQ